MNDQTQQQQETAANVGVTGVIGRKMGMTRVFQETGRSVPVTVIQVLPNRVTQIKSADKDGYDAIQLTSGSARVDRLSKAEAGHFAAAKVEPGDALVEFRLKSAAECQLGDEVSLAEVFTAGQKVDVCGRSKGKGFAGVVKRWNFRTQDASHGNSLAHRAPGSIGQCQTPGKVWKGKKMAGHMGSERVTVQGLELLEVDTQNNLLLIKGAVPGASGSRVLVSASTRGGG